MARKRHLEWQSDEDLLYVDLETSRGHVDGFALQYVARIGGCWREVLRFDTAHARLHVHRFWRDVGAQVQDLESTRRIAAHYDHEVTAFLEDLELNWMRYRRLMEDRLALDPLHGLDAPADRPAPEGQ